ncbi:MAG: diguanylate cyclase [Bacteroidota bacterium]
MTKLQKVLVVDASRVVRASLTRSLKGHFEVCEDADGESAWQTLVLDSSIAAVIAGGKLAKLDGIGLVERMRENRLCRLNRMPFFLLASDSFSLEDRQCASLSGVSGFIAKGMAGGDIRALLNRFVEQLPLVHNRRAEAGGPPAAAAPYTGEQSLTGATDIMGRIGGLAGGLEPPATPNGQPRAALLCRQEIDRLLQEFLPAAGGGRPLGLLVFGLDGYDGLECRYGDGLARRVAEKISALLANKIRAEDSIGEVAPGRLAIIAPGTDLALCAGFANRVCKALAAAQISLRGQRVGMTVSVGIAALPENGVACRGEDLLRLAERRLEAAMRAGGNRVVADDVGERNSSLSHDDFVLRLKELLAAAAPGAMTNCLGNVGLQIMPILSQIEQVFHFGLPIDDMGRRLGERAQAERLGG